MKVGDLVRVNVHDIYNNATGVIVRMIAFGPARIPLPHVLVGGKVLLFGREACEVINEGR